MSTPRATHFNVVAFGVCVCVFVFLDPPSSIKSRTHPHDKHSNKEHGLLLWRNIRHQKFPVERRHCPAFPDPTTTIPKARRRKTNMLKPNTQFPPSTIHNENCSEQRYRGVHANFEALPFGRTRFTLSKLCARLVLSRACVRVW